MDTPTDRSAAATSTPEAAVKAPLFGQSGAAAAVAAAILSAACWGSATVMTKGVLDHLPPMTLLVIQLAASVVFLWTVVLFQRVRVRLDRPTRRASLSGLLEPGIAYTVGIAGLALTTASNASLIGTVEPLFTLFLAWLLLRERVGASILSLAFLATIGIVLVALPDIADGAGEGALLGDILIAIGTLFAALYVIATRRLVLTIDPLPLSALQQSMGLLWVVFVTLAGLVLGIVPLGLNGVAWEVFLLAAVSGIVQYAMAFWLYLYALRRLPANIAALYLALIPVFGVGAAYAFLGESLVLVQWIGAVLIVASAAAVVRVSGRRG